MPTTDLNLGTTANDGTGDTLRAGGQIINDNFAVVQSDLVTHINDNNNPHSVTKAQVGLSNVDNTSDSQKPISTAAAAKNTAQDNAIALNTAKNTYPSGDASKVANLPANQNAVNTTLQSNIDDKQDELVSGTNIKTVNSQSLLGSGNIEIIGGGAVDSVNTQTGDVVLDADDISDASTTNKFVQQEVVTTLGSDNTTIPTSKAVADAITGSGGGDMLSSNNLSDVASVSDARTNLGLGTLATLDTVDTAQIEDNAVTQAKIDSTYETNLAKKDADNDFSTSQTIDGTVISGDGLEIGQDGSGDRNTFIDFHSADTPANYNARIDRFPGVDGNFTFAQTGAGNFVFSGGAYINAGSKKIMNLSTPTLGTDAVNKDYADTKQSILSEGAFVNGDKTKLDSTLITTDIGSTVQAYDANTVKSDEANIFSELNTYQGSGKARILIQETTGTIGNTAELLFQTTSAAGNFKKGGILYEDNGSSFARGDLHICTNNTALEGDVTKTDARITVLAGGNVGIGTTSPNYRGHINGSFGITPGIGTTVTPVSNGDLTISTASNTSVVIRLKGSDGVIRSTTLTLS